MAQVLVFFCYPLNVFSALEGTPLHLKLPSCFNHFLDHSFISLFIISFQRFVYLLGYLFILCRSGFSSDRVAGFADARRALSVTLSDVCPMIPVCDPMARYRTADGSCNNLLNPLWGAHDTPQPRLLEPAYQNGNACT